MYKKLTVSIPEWVDTELHKKQCSNFSEYVTEIIVRSPVFQKSGGGKYEKRGNKIKRDSVVRKTKRR